MVKHKKRNWKLRFIVCAILAGSLAWWQRDNLFNTEAHAKTPTVQPPAFTLNPSWPIDAKAAAVGIQGHGPLASSNDAEPRPIASIAKVITALALLEKRPLKPDQDGPMIEITANDEQLYRDYVAQNGTVVLVRAGAAITQRDALEAMLLPSANNIADTAAIWAFGSLEEYRSYANSMLKRYGLKNSTVGTDASGLDPSTKSTASDLVRLGELALANPTLRQIMAMHSAEMPVAGVIPNYNKLVTQYGFSGLKPGESVEAGNTLLFSVEEKINGKNETVIGAILGTEGYRESNRGAIDLVNSVARTIKPTTKTSDK